MEKEKEARTGAQVDQSLSGVQDTLETILANLYQAALNGGWNEQLLHRAVKKLLAEEPKNGIF